MYSRLIRTSVGALVALACCVAFVGSAEAAASAKTIAKCSGAIVKAGAAFVQAEAKILQKCREATLKGKVCDNAKTQASIDKARAKLGGTITKACQGKDKSCNTIDADDTQPSLADIGWNIGTCPDFEVQGCTNAITDCDDIPTCIQCIAEESVNQAIDLYYPSGRPSSTGNKALNKCQATIGKASATFLAAKSKALAKCWGTKIKKPANCPADAAAAIAAAKAKLGAGINKACAGLDNSTVGLPAECTIVTPDGGSSCGGSNISLTDIVDCVGCVTEYKVDCPDRIGALAAGATYPAACQAALPTPIPTATVTPTPQITSTPSPTVTSTPGVCGDNQVQAGEFCDGSGTGGACGPSFPCTVDCTCDCPTQVHFVGDPTDPATILDTGWTGIAHRAPVISNGDVTINISCAVAEHPCGVCTVSGPVANTGASELRNQRCTNDTSIQCTNNTPCTTSHCIGGANEDAACTVDSQCPSSQCSGAGTCQFLFGAPLPLVAGGVGTCVENVFNGGINGTANVETGEAVTTVNLTSRVHSAVISTDTPCPVCVNDPTDNDNVLGGTCTGGNRSGKTCDANGSVPGRDDFGTTSYDCPPPIATIAVLPIDLSNSTATVNKTLSASSPNCTAGSLPAGTKCVCDTCNNAAAGPCDSNADCPTSGGNPGICGGRRCLGGSNIGAPCNTATQCPGGSCARPGQPTQPNGCVDDSTTGGIDGSVCVDTAPIGDNEGECPEDPPSGTCSSASGHPQRSCDIDAECCDDPPGCVSDPATVGDCQIGKRLCFLDNGVNGNSITGTGMADPPVEDVSEPTLAAVFCIGPTSAPAVNIAAGLPGPGRVTIKGTATGIP